MCPAAGKYQAEYSAARFARLPAADVDVPLVLTHDVRGDPKAQTRSPRAFRCNEGIVHALLSLRAYAYTCIAKGDSYCLLASMPVVASPHADGELAAAGHCLDRIGDQIHENLTHLAGKAHQPRRVAPDEGDLNA